MKNWRMQPVAADVRPMDAASVELPSPTKKNGFSISKWRMAAGLRRRNFEKRIAAICTKRAAAIRFSGMHAVQ